MRPPGKVRGRRPSRILRQEPVKSPEKEIEVKLRLGDRNALLRRLMRLKAQCVFGRLHEMNTLYDTSDGALARRGQMMRIRIEEPVERSSNWGGKHPKRQGAKAGDTTALVTYKGPPEADSSDGLPGGHRYKVRAEHEVRVADAGPAASILEALGLRPWFRYEKYRTSFYLPRLRNVKVELDETPIGDFIELEGDRSGIDEAATNLGFGPADYITKSYGALYLEHCGFSHNATSPSEPTPGSGLPDMLFRKRN